MQKQFAQAFEPDPRLVGSSSNQNKSDLTKLSQISPPFLDKMLNRDQVL